MGDLSKDVELCLLQPTAVFENQVLVVGLNRKRSNDSLVGLAIEIDAQIKIQWIIFNDRRVHG